MKRSERYHHGNLRQALLDAAEELLVAGGIEALGWREIARRAGVSAGAPYHHFAGMELSATPVFGTLLQVVRACRDRASASKQEDEIVALAAWGLVHGIAALLLDGPLASHTADREFVRALVATSTAHFDVNR